MNDELKKHPGIELSPIDLENAVGGADERVSLSDFSIVKSLDKASTASGGGAGKVQMQDFHFVQK